MPTETAAGLIGLKSGLFAGLLAIVASVFAVAVGFTVVPLASGRELQDAARRLAAGLLSSFTLGLLFAAKALSWWPELLHPWQKMLPGEPDIVIYVAASIPFLALAALPGFWIVAALMRYFTNRADKDLGGLGRDVAEDVRATLGPRP